MLNPAALLPLHRKSLHKLFLFLAAFTLSTPLVSCGDGPKAKGRTFGKVIKDEAVPLSIISTETDIDSAVKKYLGKHFTFKNILPYGPDAVNDYYSSKNKCGFEFHTPDQKVSMTAWINMPVLRRFDSSATNRPLPSVETDFAKVFEVNVDLCSENQHWACFDQSLRLGRQRDKEQDQKINCNFSPENIYVSGTIAGIRKIERDKKTKWFVAIIPTGISN